MTQVETTQALKELIETELSSGDIIPYASDLAIKLGVEVHFIQRALRILSTEGLIEKQKTFGHTRFVRYVVK